VLVVPQPFDRKLEKFAGVLISAIHMFLLWQHLAYLRFITLPFLLSDSPQMEKWISGLTVNCSGLFSKDS
jgi:hypothetical protein